MGFKVSGFRAGLGVYLDLLNTHNECHLPRNSSTCCACYSRYLGSLGRGLCKRRIFRIPNKRSTMELFQSSSNPQGPSAQTLQVQIIAYWAEFPFFRSTDPLQICSQLRFPLNHVLVLLPQFGTCPCLDKRASLACCERP